MFLKPFILTLILLATASAAEWPNVLLIGCSSRCGIGLVRIGSLWP
jgi:hypothetical protein